MKRLIAINQSQRPTEKLAKKRGRPTVEVQNVLPPKKLQATKPMNEIPVYSLPEYLEAVKVTSPMELMSTNPDYPVESTSKQLWIHDGTQYYLLQAYLASPVQTDTEVRSSFPENSKSLYIKLFEYTDPQGKHPEKYKLIAKFRHHSEGFRDELMKINAGENTSGSKALLLKDQLITHPFNINKTTTLHDASFIRIGTTKYSLRKMRKLAGVVPGSIYERDGLKTATFYQQSVGKYNNHTQIPAIEKMATECLHQVPLDWVSRVFAPLFKAPIYPSIQSNVETVLSRWCVDPKKETIQSLFSQFLTASKHFRNESKPTATIKTASGKSCSKSEFASDLNIIQNVLLSELYSEADEATIRESFSTSGFSRWDIQSAAALQCALNCLDSHIIFEQPPEDAPGTPLSQTLKVGALHDTPDFRHVIVKLNEGQIPLTWGELCRSSKIRDLFADH